MNLQDQAAPTAVHQRTLKSLIKATGVTVHTGERSELTLRPAPVNTGIVFRAVTQGNVLIPAKTQYVTDTTLSTTISKDGASISTIEHLMSAFAGLGIDNAYVDVTTREIPIMDGSAAPFGYLIQSAGIVEQEELKKFIKINQPIEVKRDGKVARLSPYAGFKAAFDIEYEHAAIKKDVQHAEFDLSKGSFASDISRARTYGFMSDYEKIRAMDLAKGASLDNAVVMDDFKVLNDGGLRFPDELVRHKILDAIGDLSLLGANLIGQFYGLKSGHALNNELAAAVLANESCWEYVTFEGQAASPVSFMMPQYAANPSA